MKSIAEGFKDSISYAVQNVDEQLGIDIYDKSQHYDKFLVLVNGMDIINETG